MHYTDVNSKQIGQSQ